MIIFAIGQLGWSTLSGVINAWLVTYYLPTKGDRSEELEKKEKRTPVPEAAISCEANVKGAGNLLAFASADLKDTEPYTSPHVKTWKGRALLVVRSTQKKGSVNVSIKSALPTASLSLKSKSCCH